MVNDWRGLTADRETTTSYKNAVGDIFVWDEKYYVTERDG